MVGITNFTNVTQEQILGMTNLTTPIDFFIYINNVVFEGYGFYLLLWALFIILFISAQNFRKEPLSNGLYSSGLVSIIAIFLRGIQASIDGNYIAMLTDYQMWTFPLIASILGGIIWATKKF